MWLIHTWTASQISDWKNSISKSLEQK